MNLQDHFPYDGAILGLDNQYIAYDDKFYVNDDRIDVIDKIIRKDEIYMMTERDGDLLSSFSIHMKEVFYFGRFLYLMYIDLRNRNVLLKKLQFTKFNDPNPRWKLSTCRE